MVSTRYRTLQPPTRSDRPSIPCNLLVPAPNGSSASARNAPEKRSWTVLSNLLRYDSARLENSSRYVIFRACETVPRRQSSCRPESLLVQPGHRPFPHLSTHQTRSTPTPCERATLRPLLRSGHRCVRAGLLWRSRVDSTRRGKFGCHPIRHDLSGSGYSIPRLSRGGAGNSSLGRPGTR